MSIIDDLIASFFPISLEKMDEVQLLDRMDTKFVFSARKLPFILGQLASSYYMLEIGQKRIQRYETLYFDTPELKCYFDHHNKRMNRFKIRSRHYLDSGVCYFEIKIKNNKDRTRKERNKQIGEQEIIVDKPALLLEKCTGLTAANIVPALWVSFTRMTLVNLEMNERITIDTGLKFRQDGNEKAYPGVVIAEIKQNRACPSQFRQILRYHHIRDMRISKYCLGMITINHDLKCNRFKEKLHYLNKIQHDLI